jgi:murein DD-endopeptidase MepM/ murein hydrolase activator NlpD
LEQRKIEGFWKTIGHLGFVGLQNPYMAPMLLIELLICSLVGCDGVSPLCLPRGTRIPVAHAFDFPVGKPDAKGYLNKQPFGMPQPSGKHLGEDWNGPNGGDTDLGDPVYAIADGYVHDATEYGNESGWGKVVQIIHQLSDGKQVESLYAHIDTMLVIEGQKVKRGQRIGTIGNAGVKDNAHLHFELRERVCMGVGSGYSDYAPGYIEPTGFILAHRGDM